MEIPDSVMTRSAALATLSWWRDAGVDTLVDDAPRNWLAPPAPAEPRPDVTDWQATAPAAAPPSPARSSPPAASRTTDIDLSDLKSALAGCATLDALRAAAAAVRPRPIFADGDPASGVMIIGETAAPDDDRTGRPFSGPSGELLDKMLAAIGRGRSSTYISNLMLWRSFGKAAPADVAVGHAILLRHIELAKPRALLLMGGEAAKALLATQTGITQLRGKWVDLTAGSHPVPALPTFNPAYLLRRPADKRMAWADLLMFKAKIDAD